MKLIRSNHFNKAQDSAKFDTATGTRLEETANGTMHSAMRTVLKDTAKQDSVVKTGVNMKNTIIKTPEIIQTEEDKLFNLINKAKANVRLPKALAAPHTDRTEAVPRNTPKNNPKPPKRFAAPHTAKDGTMLEETASRTSWRRPPSRLC